MQTSTAMPGVPLDDELLAMLSVGIPVGLGIYYGWVHRNWSVGGRAIGFAAALAGGVGGARLGFHAAEDLLALVTAIVGAVAGANLTLILFDMARARFGHERVAQRRREELKGIPATG